MDLKRQRGFVMPLGIWGYLIAAIVILGLMLAIFHYVDTHWETSAGVKKGEASMKAKWDQKNREAGEAATVQRMADELTAKTAAAELASVQKKANDYETKWRQERAKRPPLAQCKEAPPGSNAPPSVVFSPEFVRLYDGSWTDRAGQPVFPNQAAGAQQPAPAVDPDRLLDVHGENASRCSADRRKLDSLIDQIEALGKGWKLNTSCVQP